MIILGLNAYHGDSSACVVVDGNLAAAVEEERFRRVKHWAGFPSRAIEYCLSEAGIAVEDVDHIAVNRNPSAHIIRKALFALRKLPSPRLVKDRCINATRVRGIKQRLAEEFGAVPANLKAEVWRVEHHVAHLSSAFFVSPFEKATVVSVDGFGDFVGAMWGVGRGGAIEIKKRIFFPHSLGLFYLALTQFLGFPRYGDEYKVMGLAAYGEPVYEREMRRIVNLNGNGTFELNLDCFVHHTDNVTMSWRDGAPEMGPVYSPEMNRLLGRPRGANEPVTSVHKNIAASMQAMYEKAFFHLLNHVYSEVRTPTLCLAGGCAMNSVANGKILDNTEFGDVYIQPAAGDAGGAIGAAFHVWNQLLAKPRSFVLTSPYLGPGCGNAEIKQELDRNSAKLRELGCTFRETEGGRELCRKTAREIADGKVVGWFQGRLEWGPRALGNRSIVCDPRRSDIRDLLNAKIKRRESFRPFAPSIHLEATGEYFETDSPDPFMSRVFTIRPEKRSIIPAVTHVDGTGRLQTVRRQDNPLYWELIEQFRLITGVPVVLNTSFNENEPIVCLPAEALDCFMRTKMDMLVLGDFVVERK